jgi:hypothetical protein
MHELGTLGEMAVAEYLGMSDRVFSSAEPVWGSSDLPHDVEVKTRSRHWHDLIVQKGERPDKIVVLVTIEGGDIRLQGWCKAGDVMEERYWSDPAGGRAAYFIPKNLLEPAETLKDLLSTH